MLFEVDKECKHSRRYKAAGDFILDTVYVKRPFADQNEDLVITVEGYNEKQNMDEVTDIPYEEEAGE